MIDDYTKARELVEKMESQLPIPVIPKKPLIYTLRDRLHEKKVQKGQMDSSN